MEPIKILWIFTAESKYLGAGKIYSIYNIYTLKPYSGKSNKCYAGIYPRSNTSPLTIKLSVIEKR